MTCTKEKIAKYDASLTEHEDYPQQDRRCREKRKSVWHKAVAEAPVVEGPWQPRYTSGASTVVNENHKMDFKGK